MQITKLSHLLDDRAQSVLHQGPPCVHHPHHTEVCEVVLEGTKVHCLRVQAGQDPAHLQQEQEEEYEQEQEYEKDYEYEQEQDYEQDQEYEVAVPAL